MCKINDPRFCLTNNPHPYQSDEWFVHNQVHKLKEIAVHGLDPVYPGIEDYWYDFWPNFAWQEDRQNAQVRLLLGHSEFEWLEEQIQQKFGVSLREELTRDEPVPTVVN